MDIERKLWGEVYSTTMGPEEARELESFFINTFIESMTANDVVIVRGTLRVSYAKADPYTIVLDDGTGIDPWPQVGVMAYGYMSPYSPWDGYY